MTNQPICDLCKEPCNGALMECKDCGTNFCHKCANPIYDTKGQVVEVYSICPKCKSDRIRL